MTCRLFGASVLGSLGTANSTEYEAIRQVMALNQAAQMANEYRDYALNAWSAPLPKPPGIYWRRTGGKTHTVEIVR